MLTERRVLIAVISSAVAMVLMFFFDSILSDHLLDIGVPESDIGKHNPVLKLSLGYFFGLICFFYIITAPAIVWICKKVKRRYVTQVSFILASVALFCFGPSKVFGLPYKSIPLTLAGLALLGVGAASIFVPLLSEIIEAIQLKYVIGESPYLIDKASGLFNIAYSLGCIIAPILGGFLNTKV